MTTNQPTNQPAPPPTHPFANDDLLWRQLKTIPAFRALLRAVESRFYFAVDLPGPTLDVGCGDGHFAQMTFDRAIDVGIDPWWGPLKKAHRADAYQLALQGMGDRLPFPDHSFASAFSNSVLEHIPDVEAVLQETSRVLQPNGRFLITMPSQYFTQWLGGAQFLEKMSLPGLADRYRRGFNVISRHVHTDGPEIWATRLADAGLAVERWQYYFSPQALHALEIGHAQGLPAAAMHFLSGHWILAPWESSLRPTERWLRPFYEEEAGEQGAYLLIVARKMADGPIPARLPAARPFTIAELETAVQQRRAAEPPPLIPDITLPAETAATLLPPPVPETSAVPPPEENGRTRRVDLVAGGLLLLSLALAYFGQTTARQAAAEPWQGMGWFTASFAALLLLLWRLDGSRPATPRRLPRIRLGAMPRRRWGLLPALLLVWLAYRQAANFAPWPPWLTLTLWLGGIALAFFALGSAPPPPSEIDAPPAEEERANGRFLIISGLILTLTAFIVRVVGLSSHPFILNGLEAGIGLDVAAVAEGTAVNPFATGWLTNPTLPYFLMALPVNLLGPSLLSIRLLSPLVGALTVLATLWLGTRLWRLEVGLVAAVLLTGSHFHLHYSRLGLTNVWDSLLLTLALGLLLLAWRAGENGRARRRDWLLAGLLMGLNGYVFTASRLLPLILLALALLALVWHRAALRRQASHIGAALLLACLVALPQMLYYQAHPGLFWDRFRATGILAGQTDWLAQTAVNSGRSQLSILGDQLGRALLAFNANSDLSPAYRPDAPLLSAIPAVLFVLGLFLTLLRARQARYGWLPVTLVVTLLFGVALLIEAPSSHRLVLVAPLLSLLAALALVEVARWGQQVVDNGGRAYREWLLPGLLVLAILLALNEMFFYYGRYRLSYSFGDRNTEVAQGVADYLNNLDGATWEAHFFGPPSMYVSFPTIPFLVTDFQAGVNLFDVAADNAEPPVAAATHMTLIYLPERVDEMGQAQAVYGNGRAYSFPGYHANPLFYVYEVTAP